MDSEDEAPKKKQKAKEPAPDVNPDANPAWQAGQEQLEDEEEALTSRGGQRTDADSHRETTEAERNDSNTSSPSTLSSPETERSLASFKNPPTHTLRASPAHGGGEPGEQGHRAST